MTRGHNYCPNCGHTIKRHGSLDEHDRKCLSKPANQRKYIKDRRFPGVCELCGRNASDLHGHHLKPHQYGYGVADNTMNTCIDCSRMVHALVTNREMLERFNTKESLMSLPTVRDYVDWIKVRRVGVVKHPKTFTDRKVMRNLRRMER